MSDSEREEHLWFQARLDARVLGLLDESEESRFDRHEASCAPCAEAMKRFRENLPVVRPDDHIPPRVLARWDRAQRKLRGLARQLVREHLAGCAACRQDLEALGFAPTLEIIPELEPESETSRESLPMPADSPVVVIVRGSTRRWRHWLLGGSAGAALATAASVLVVSYIARPVPQATPGGQADTTARPGPGASAFGVGIVASAIELAAATRGDAREDQVIRIHPETRFVQVRLPDLFLPDTTRVRIEVHGPGDALVSSIDEPYGALARGRAVIFGDPSLPLPPGRYRLAVRAQSAGAPLPPLEFGLRLETGPTP